MPKPPTPALSDAQLEIMNVVWERGEVTVTDVWQVLVERRRIARNTVQTVMSRLAERGWLAHRQVGNRFVYTAAVERDTAGRSMLDGLLEGAFGGSTEGLVMALLEKRGLSAAEARRIRAMIAQAERRKGKRS